MRNILLTHYRLSVFTFNTQYHGIHSSCKEMFKQGLSIYDILLINVHEKHEFVLVLEKQPIRKLYQMNTLYFVLNHTQKCYGTVIVKNKLMFKIFMAVSPRSFKI
jgi:hypothetical protein